MNKMFEELAILFYLPVVFGLKWYISTLEPSTKNYLSSLLEYPWVGWCASLSVFSCLGMFYTGKWLLDNMILNNKYPIHGSPTEYWFYAFMASKVWEFIDTLFIVSRSKHLSQLQWFHHFATAVIVYLVKPISCDVFTWLFFLNYFVHFFMYGYFALYPFFPIVMKKFGTFVNFIQTSQMVLAIFITAYYNFTFNGSNCVWMPSDSYSNFLVGIITAMYAYYGYLFLHLFYERSERIKRE